VLFNSKVSIWLGELKFFFKTPNSLIRCVEAPGSLSSALKLCVEVQGSLL
jgi:hypothetical protein